MKSQYLKKVKLPEKPGVYFFMGKSSPPRLSGTSPRKGGDAILYIGKATSLRDRVKSYFGKDLIETRGPLILDMVFKANRLKWQETDSVLEALILEANLIKKHQPYYNTKEKDDKSFNYVCITDEAIPMILVERGKNIDFKTLHASRYALRGIFGPFTSGPQLREALKIIRRIFPFIDKSSAKKDNYEFYRQLGLAPDINNYELQITNDELLKRYRKNIRHIKLFFEGKKKQILRSLEKEMKALAKEKKFEDAGRVRNQIFALKHINDVALLKDEAKSYKLSAGSFRIEAYDIAHLSGKNMVGVMTVVTDGMVNKNEYRKFIVRTQKNANDTGALEEILSRRFRHTEWGMPDIVAVDGGVAQLRVAEQVLKRYQLAIPVVSVLKDERHRPKDILGDRTFAVKYKKSILLANSEAHRFGIRFHKEKRGKSFLQ